MRRLSGVLDNFCGGRYLGSIRFVKENERRGEGRSERKKEERKKERERERERGVEKRMWLVCVFAPYLGGHLSPED